MAKLSKKQSEVISKMREGWNVHYLTGLEISGWLSSSNSHQVSGLSIATIFALEKGKYIERDDSDWRSVDFKLTELGRTCALTNLKVF